MACTTTSSYKENIYNPDVEQTISVIINNKTVDPSFVKAIKYDDKIFEVESISIGNAVAREIQLELSNQFTEEFTEVSLSSTLHIETPETLALGTYMIVEKDNSNDYYTKYILHDYMDKFHKKYDASSIVPCTRFALLQSICNYCGVELENSSIINGDVIVNTYDNTIEALEYVRCIAERAAGNAKITRYNKLRIKELNTNENIILPNEMVGDYSYDDEKTITKVIFENATQKFEKGNNTGECICLSQYSPFSCTQEEVNNIFQSLNELTYQSLKARIWGDPSVDAGDRLTYGNIKSFAQMSWQWGNGFYGEYDCSLKTNQQTSLVERLSNSQKIRRIKSILDESNMQIDLLLEENDENKTSIANLNLNLESIKSSVTKKIEDLENDTSPIAAQKGVKSATIYDAAEKSIMWQKTYGKTTQKNRAGYNILKNSSFSNDLSDWAVLKSGTTPEITTYNGKKCLHFKGSLGSRQHVSQSIEKRIAVGKTYTVTCMAFLKDFVAGTTNCFLSFYFDGKKTDGTWTGESIVSGAAAFNSKSYDYSKGTFIKTKYTFKIKEDTDLTKAFGFYIYARDFTGDLYVYDVQIAEGTEAKDWEDFGISPSTEFPSVIAGVGRENYFNKNASPKSYGVSTSVLDTGVRETITVAGNYKYCAFRLGGAELLGKTMTIGMTITPSASNTGLATIYFGNASSVSKQAVLNSTLSGTGNKSVTLNLPTSMPSDCTDINLLLYANGTGTGNVGDYVDYTNLIINEGRELKKYVPYEHTEIGFEINNANLWNDDLLYNTVTKTDDKFTIDGWAQLVLDNDAIIKMFKPNTKYTIKIIRKITSIPSTIKENRNGDLVLYRPAPSYWNALDLYDKGKDKVSVGDVITTYQTITTPSDLTDIRLLGYAWYGNDDGSTTYKGCGSIEIQQIMVVEGEYTENDFPEYKKHNSQAVAIDLQGNELYSLENGTKDEIDVANGKVTLIKKTKEFTLAENKTMSASALTNTTRFVIYNVASSSDDFLYAMSTHFCYMVDYNADKEHFYIARNGAMYLFVNKSIASTVDELKTWLSKNNVKFLYELAEPEEIDLSKIDLPNAYRGINYITFTELSDFYYYRDNALNEIYVSKDENEKQIRNINENFAKQEITNNSIIQRVQETNETMSNNYALKEEVSSEIQHTKNSLTIEFNEQIEDLQNKKTDTLKNQLVTIDVNGIEVSTNLSTVSTIMRNDRFAIKSGDTEAFYVGYDENLKKSVSRMNDLTITDYFTAGYHRQEKFEIDGEKRTGWFFVGGE